MGEFAVMDNKKACLRTRQCKELKKWKIKKGRG